MPSSGTSSKTSSMTLQVCICILENKKIQKVPLSTVRAATPCVLLTHPPFVSVFQICFLGSSLKKWWWTTARQRISSWSTGAQKPRLSWRRWLEQRRTISWTGTSGKLRPSGSSPQNLWGPSRAPVWCSGAGPRAEMEEEGEIWLETCCRWCQLPVSGVNVWRLKWLKRFQWVAVTCCYCVRLKMCYCSNGGHSCLLGLNASVVSGGHPVSVEGTAADLQQHTWNKMQAHSLRWSNIRTSLTFLPWLVNILWKY